MSTLKVLMVGLEENEIWQCEQILGRIFDDLQVFSVRFWSDLEKRELRQANDFALVSSRGESPELGVRWSEQDIRSGLPAVIALVDIFEPARVVQLVNSGAKWVIPFDKLEELLPVCVSSEGYLKPVQKTELPPKERIQQILDPLSQLPSRSEKNEGHHLLLESILNTFNTIITILDRDGKILFLNHYAELITGYSFEEVKGRNFSDLFLLPEEKRHVLSVLQQLVKDGQAVQNQNSWLTKEGASRLIEWSNSVLKNPNGEVSYLIGIGVDITEQSSRSQARHQSEERFARIFQTSPMGIGIVRYKDGRFIDANESLLRMLGCAKDFLITNTPVEAGLLAPNEMWELLDQVVRTRPAINLERKLSLASHRNLRIQISLEMVVWGGESAVLLIVQDVTERWQAEERARKLNSDLERRVLERTAALQAVNRELAAEIGFRKAVEESSQRLIQIIWETPDVVGICNLDGYLMYVNKAGRRMFDLSEVDPVGHISVYDVYPEDLRAHMRNEVSPVIVREGLWSGETEFILPTGRRIAVSQVLLAHRDAEGKVIFFSTIARDISDQKQDSREIELAYRREKELGILRTNFFSMTSHQFRTPLSAIFSSAELLEHYGGKWSEEKRGHHLRRIQNEIKRMTQMLDNILTLSRIESPSFDLSFEVVDLCELIKHSIQEAETVDGNRHSFKLDCILGPLEVRTSPEIINRIFDNLLTNAEKYAPAGTDIEIVLAVEGKEAVISIKDYGVGIPEDEMGMIFQPFYRASNVMDTPGTGLGLLIVQKSLQLLGGGIQINSRLGEGTRVVMQIPLRML